MAPQKTLKTVKSCFRTEYYSTIKSYCFQQIKLGLFLLESSCSSFSVLHFYPDRSKDINLRLVTGAGLHIAISGLQASVNFKVDGIVNVFQAAWMLWFFFCLFSNFINSWLFKLFTCLLLVEEILEDLVYFLFVFPKGRERILMFSLLPPLVSPKCTLSPTCI